MTGVTDARRAQAGSTHGGTPARRAPWDIYAVVIVCAAALVLRLWPLGGDSLDYQDEGAYWQSLRAMAAGYPLFSAIFSSQPPFFLLSLYPWYLLFGQSIVAARLAIALYSLLGLAAAYAAGRAVAGRLGGLAACVLLAADPFYLLESHILQAEMPALALALLGVAFAAGATRGTGVRRRVLATAAGAAIGLGTMAKLFDVVALIPAVLYLAAPRLVTAGDDGAHPRRPNGDADPRRPDGVIRRTELRAVLPDIALLVAGVVVACAAVLWPYLADLRAVYDQVVTFHQVAQRISLSGQPNVDLIRDTIGQSYPILYPALAAIAVALAFWRRSWVVVPPLLWLLASLLLLVRQQPLISHQIVLLSPPLALTAGLALSLAMRGMAPTPLRWHAPWPRLSQYAVPALVVLAVLAGLLQGLRADRAPVKGPPPSSALLRAMARALRDATRPGEVVVTDGQYVAGLAGRSVPPELVDTSIVRIQAVYLTAPLVETIVQRDRVRTVLFATGRFNVVLGFPKWVRRHFRRVKAFPEGHALYQR